MLGEVRHDQVQDKDRHLQEEEHHDQVQQKDMLELVPGQARARGLHDQVQPQQVRGQQRGQQQHHDHDQQPSWHQRLYMLLQDAVRRNLPASSSWDGEEDTTCQWECRGEEY